MIKTVPTAARLATMILFALSSFGALLYLWMAFGGGVPFKPDGYRVDVLFPEATQLAEQSDVRISGVSVGKVVAIEPGVRNRTKATLELDEKYAPLPADSRAVLRLKSLLGETFVELSPGNGSGRKLTEGDELPVAAVSPTVELDEVLRTFDAPTRESFRDWMQASARALDGRGKDVNQALGQLPGWVEETTDLTRTLDAQSAAVRKVVAATGDVFDAISQREGDLSGLITETERLFGVTADRNRELQQLFRELPRFERESSRTLPLLTSFGERAEPVMRQLQPAATELEPTFDAVDRLSPQFEGFFTKLGPTVDASKEGLPGLQQVLTDIPPLLEKFQPFLRNANPMVGYIGEHRREVTAFFANTVGSSLARSLDLTGASGKPLHYLRASQTLSPEALAFYERPVGSSRQNAYPVPGWLDQLAAGLPAFTTEACANGTPAPPTAGIPETLPPLIQTTAFRTPGRDVARPACKEQGPYPGFGTKFPQLRAEK
ncbi:MAG TPA: MlaD family protein [Solirubrobacteraceae bacterium]|nr:MlaD family protein [Solirubrobacteraceae bacterium]